MAVSPTAIVSIDCADPASLAEFWVAMLGGDIAFTRPNAVGVRSSGGLWLVALRVDDFVPPTWPAPDVPKQIHLDLPVTDLSSAVSEAESLGATIAPVQPNPDVFRVLRDPAGHPFCLTTGVRPDRLT
jgi:hypothetical protein